MELTAPEKYAARGWSTQVAIDIATEAHAGQMDKVGRPYIEHPAVVAGLVAQYGPEAVQLAWLHDAVEDTPWTLDMLRAAGAPETVVAGVDAMTKRPGEPRDVSIARAAADPLGLICKAADNAHNSDEKRLAKIDDPAERERLAQKYARERLILRAAGAPDFKSRLVGFDMARFRWHSGS